MNLHSRLPLPSVPHAFICRTPLPQLLLHHIPPAKRQCKNILLCHLPRNSATGRGIAPVSIHGNNPLEPIGINTAKNIRQQILKRLQTQIDRTGKSHIIMRKPRPHRRRNNHGKIIHALGNSHRHIERRRNIHIHRTMRPVLLHRSHRHNHHGIARQSVQKLLSPHLLPHHLLVAAIVRNSIHD